MTFLHSHHHHQFKGFKISLINIRKSHRREGKNTAYLATILTPQPIYRSLSMNAVIRVATSAFIFRVDVVNGCSFDGTFWCRGKVRNYLCKEKYDARNFYLVFVVFVILG